MEITKDVFKICVLTTDFVYEILGIGICYSGYALNTALDSIPLVPIAIAAFGIVAVIMATVGIIGCIQESFSKLKIVLTIILLTLIALKLVGIVTLHNLTEYFEKINNDKFKVLWPYEDTPILQPENDNGPLAQIEKTLFCCGETGPADYSDPPKSCLDKFGVPFLKGCYDKYMTYSLNKIERFSNALIVLVSVEIVCVCFTGLFVWKLSDMYV